MIFDDVSEVRTASIIRDECFLPQATCSCELCDLFGKVRKNPNTITLIAVCYDSTMFTRTKPRLVGDPQYIRTTSDISKRIRVLKRPTQTVGGKPHMAF
jgi:hypothetical protein